MPTTIFEDVVSALRQMFKLLASAYLVYLPFALRSDPAIASLGNAKLGFDATLCLYVAMLAGLVGLMSCFAEVGKSFGPSRPGDGLTIGAGSSSPDHRTQDMKE
jgi:hypothetical protein